MNYLLIQKLNLSRNMFQKRLKILQFMSFQKFFKNIYNYLRKGLFLIQ